VLGLLILAEDSGRCCAPAIAAVCAELVGPATDTPTCAAEELEAVGEEVDVAVVRPVTGTAVDEVAA